MKGRPELSGFNLTAPFKQKIIPYLDDQTPRAEQLGSVNTVRVEQGRLLGENTDWYGVCATLTRMADHSGPALILGAGGVLPSVIRGLRHFGFGPITVCCRQPDQIDARALGLDDTDAVEPFARRHDLLASQTLVVNATPIGRLLMSVCRYVRRSLAVQCVHWDLIYRSEGTTPWMEQSPKQGTICSWMVGLC